ncbi:MAG: 6-pyruvoyl-tetrahydropterin synthase-related protein [Candidatus Nanoarchaeia archaeon]|nr:6-pyruvoyl-tetrahydropterin synthase-related protein [Candidatus Nanoarchaeia archaeon]
MKNDKIFWILNFILGGYLLYRIIDQSKLLKIFPLNYTNDVAAYMASLFFLDKCGFNQMCPYWFNSFISFHTFTPGWQFFAYPWYVLTKNVLTATWISWILMFVIALIFIWILGKNEKWDTSKILFYFLFYFGNAVAVGNLIRQGRMPTMFGIVFTLGLFVLLLYYLKKELNWKFFFFFVLIEIPIILSHQQEMFLAQFLVIGFILARKFKDIIKIGVAGIVSLILTSFWWIPFLKNLASSRLLSQTQGEWLWLGISRELLTNITAFFVGLSFLILIFIYLRQRKSKKEFLFFLPSIVLGILFLFRLTPLVPLLENISQDPYIMFFLMIILLIFLRLDWETFPKLLKKLIPVVLIMIIILSVLISHFKTPYFTEYTQDEYDALELFPYVQSKFIVLETAQITSHPRSYDAYLPIYYDVEGVFGFYPQIPSEEYWNKLMKPKEMLINGSCEGFVDSIEALNVSSILAYKDSCESIQNCGLDPIKEKGNYCLFYSK